MNLRSTLRRPLTWLIAVPLLVLVLAVGGPFVYIHFIKADPAERLAFADAQTTTTAGTDTTVATSGTDESIEGTWSVGDGSEAGYRVREILLGQDTTATGRTSDVTGDLVITGTTIDAAEFTVDLTTVESGEDRRDNQFHGRIMDTGTYPTAAFALTEPIVLDVVPADLEEITVSATGEFTIHGVTKPVAFELKARRNGGAIEVNGTIPVVFSDYEIPDASGGPATVADNGEIEFLLILAA